MAGTICSFIDSSLIEHLSVVCFQLQDTDTTSGESEVKFQVSRDTLGAMLRSMAYIREQLSNAVSFPPCSVMLFIWKLYRQCVYSIVLVALLLLGAVCKPLKSSQVSKLTGLET